MRRGRVVAVLAAGVFAVTGCSGDGSDNNGGSDGSTEAICESLHGQMEPLDSEFGPALVEAGMAGSQEDEEALAAAMEKLDGIIDRVTTSLNEAADRADDEQFAQALRDFGTALENLVTMVGEGDMPNMAELNTVVQELSGHCDVFNAPTDEASTE
jgi:hypothetical protein